MALQIQYEDKYGITHPEAYVHIANEVFSKDTAHAVVLNIYVDKQARIAGKLPIANKTITVDNETLVDYMLKALYADVKVDDLFIDAVDV